MKNLHSRLSCALAALLLTCGFAHAAERFDLSVSAQSLQSVDLVSAPMCAAPCADGGGDDGEETGGNDGNN